MNAENGIIFVSADAGALDEETDFNSFSFRRVTLLLLNFGADVTAVGEKLKRALEEAGVEVDVEEKSIETDRQILDRSVIEELLKKAKRTCLLVLIPAEKYAPIIGLVSCIVERRPIPLSLTSEHDLPPLHGFLMDNQFFGYC